MRLSNWAFPLKDASVWTGAFISEGGEILTTSQALGEAHIVDVELSGGTRGQACVTGRDDDIGLALLKPLIQPARTHDFLAISTKSPSVGDGLLLLQHSSYALDTQATHITSYEHFDSGYNYFQVAVGASIADGAVLINSRGELQGMHMPQPWRQRHGVGITDGVYAVDSGDIEDIALPLLRAGHIRIDIEYLPQLRLSASSPMTEPVDTTTLLVSAEGMQAAPSLLMNGLGWNPPVHIFPIYSGEVTIDGVPAPVGSVLHARVSKEGLPDYWTSDTISERGFFLMQVPVPSNEYLDAPIEFWMDCRRSPVTSTLDYPPGFAVELNLAF